MKRTSSMHRPSFRLTQASSLDAGSYRLGAELIYDAPLSECFGPKRISRFSIPKSEAHDLFIGPGEPEVVEAQRAPPLSGVACRGMHP